MLRTHLVKLACELPDDHDRSLSLWTCAELAQQLIRTGLVDSISAQSVQRLLADCKLRPWRVHFWLRSRTPHDAVFAATVQALCALYTRPLLPHECVLSVDEKTSIQPRPRTAATRPARPGIPVRLEAEYKRCGALNLLCALNTRSGQALAICRRRKRQLEFIELLELIEEQTPESIRRIVLVCDNARIHSGAKVRAWLAQHPRIELFFLPVHCSWMNQVEQFFSIVQRKRLVASRFASLQNLEQRLLQFIAQWNHNAHPFRWSAKSFDTILAKVQRPQEPAVLPLAA